MSKKLFGYGDFYCWHCGKNIEKNYETCPFCGASYDKFDSETATGLIGWSNQENHPSFAAWRRRNHKAFTITMLILSLIIGILLFIIPGELDFDSEGIKTYLGVLAIVWSIDLLWLYFQNRSTKNWDGVVISKETEDYTTTDKDSETGEKTIKYHTRYIINFKTDDNKEKKITQIDNSSWYEYLQVGERVRYHGQKGMNYYEKYDKSQQEKIPCAGCGSVRDIRENFCGRCGCAMLK